MTEKRAVVVYMPQGWVGDEGDLATVRRVLEGQIRAEGYEPMPQSFQVGGSGQSEWEQEGFVPVRMVGKR